MYTYFLLLGVGLAIESNTETHCVHQIYPVATPVIMMLQVALSLFVKGQVDPVRIFSNKKTLKHAVKHLTVGTIVKVQVQQV